MASPYIQGRVLDIGCGVTLSVVDHRLFSRYVGIDRHVEMISWLKGNYPDQQFLRLDFEDDPLPEIGKFDTILLLAVIEHLSDPARLLGQLQTRLSPGGRIVITTPPPLGILVHAVGAKMGFTYRSAAEEHQSRHSIAHLKLMLTKSGFHVEMCRRFMFGFNQICVALHQRD
jgi:2-polyprenyl-3-methyl-5-hydroxy-6-metoxy-1,4-benzoquinol methylase